MSFISFENVTKTYLLGEIKVNALQELSLEATKGEFIAIVGPSGCGKTTLLNLLGGLDKPSSGKVTVNEHIISELSRRALNSYRREKVAFIFQFYNLLPTLTGKENVLLAASLYYRSKKEAQLEAEKWLNIVGLQDKMNKFPNQLSGGEQQRVAIARSLAKKPQILLADEPTGNLDSKSAKNVIGVLKQLNEEEKISIILVTHNPAIANIADRIIYLKDGRVFGEAKPSPKDAQRFWEE
ncbi:MAG: ABC transporter ATP-binding protein [Candidatus Hodarchaeota archaeon]